MNTNTTSNFKAFLINNLSKVLMKNNIKFEILKDKYSFSNAVRLFVFSNLEEHYHIDVNIKYEGKQTTPLPNSHPYHIYGYNGSYKAFKNANRAVIFIEKSFSQHYEESNARMKK